MSALSEASGTPAQDSSANPPPPQGPSSIDTQQLHLQQQQIADQQNGIAESGRKQKAPSVRRACIACHTGKTRCSEVLPCQSCLKRGLGATCAYPDPDASEHSGQSHQTPVAAFGAPPQIFTNPNITHQYYDYNGTFTGASTSTFRPTKRPRNLTEEETAAITRGFSRGDFYVGSSAPVRVDPRLTVRLTLGEGDQVHFTIGEPLV